MMIPDKNTKIKDCADSLLVDFNTANAIPRIENEQDWRWWGNLVASSPDFAIRGAPTTEGFPNWQEWGIMIYDTCVK